VSSTSAYRLRVPQVRGRQARRSRPNLGRTAPVTNVAAVNPAKAAFAPAGTEAGSARCQFGYGLLRPAENDVAFDVGGSWTVCDVTDAARRAAGDRDRPGATLIDDQQIAGGNPGGSQ
jgi:hypothetical protein